MAKHEHGKMDITEQEKTFDGFMKWLIWGTVFCIVVLIFLALTGA
ncbi:MAG: aa3-type cytochrome c oxidase subunit IV [Rhodobacteraceae bacterium]|nr:aa3-type cytochrome c oxidase subunit IV [Paracoccaceae bacterium]